VQGKLIEVEVELCTIDLLIKVTSFVKIKIKFSLKSSWSQWLVRGGQWYWAFPLSKGFLLRVSFALIIKFQGILFDRKMSKVSANSWTFWLQSASDVTMFWQWRHNVCQSCHNVLPVTSQCSASDVTMFCQWRHNVLTVTSQCSASDVIMFCQLCHNVLPVTLQCSASDVTMFCPWCHNVLPVTSQCFDSDVTMFANDVTMFKEWGHNALD
jgi:hypothetical protein